MFWFYLFFYYFLILRATNQAARKACLKNLKLKIVINKHINRTKATKRRTKNNKKEANKPFSFSFNLKDFN